MKYTFTVDTIAEISGLKPATVRAVPKHALDMRDLSSVMSFVRASVTRRCTPADPASVLPPDVAFLWAGRWPLLELYRCPHRGCEAVLIGQTGFCRAHGGGRPAWSIEGPGHLHLSVAGRPEPYHRLVMGCPRGLVVHHKDFNRLNNRYENLQVMTREEHDTAHREAGMVCRNAASHLR